MHYEKEVKIGVIGCGYWGINLVRNFYELGVLQSVSDLNKEAHIKVKKISKNIDFQKNYKNIMENKSIDAIAIATPAKTHYKLVEQALKYDKHVFVEKPLCLKLHDANKLKAIAVKKKLKLMVGHLMLYHPAFNKMKKLIGAGKIGKIRYIYSNRLNLGKLRKDEDVLWSFAPHDISMILNLVKSKLETVDTFGGSYIKKGIKDTSITTLKFKNKVKAHIFVSWLHPYKDQRLVVIGEKGMLVFADVLLGHNKLLFYNHKVSWDKNFPLVTRLKEQKYLLII